MSDQGDPQADSVTFTGFLGSSPGEDPVRLHLDPEQTQEVHVAVADMTGSSLADGGMTNVHVRSDAPVRYLESGTGGEMLEGEIAKSNTGSFDFVRPAGVLARSNPPRACRP